MSGERLHTPSRVAPPVGRHQLPQGSAPTYYYSLSALGLAHGPYASGHVYMYTHFTFGSTHAYVLRSSSNMEP